MKCIKCKRIIKFPEEEAINYGLETYHFLCHLKALPKIKLKEKNHGI